MSRGFLPADILGRKGIKRVEAAAQQGWENEPPLAFILLLWHRRYVLMNVI